jgi:divalent metal cation (Fe/Co/Zn/Cd) transporter
MREGTGISMAVAGLITTFFTALAALLVGITYLFVCVYAIVKLIGDADGHPDPATLIVGFVAIPTVLVTGLLVGIRFLGKSLNSRKRPEEAAPWNA